MSPHENVLIVTMSVQPGHKSNTCPYKVDLQQEAEQRRDGIPPGYGRCLVMMQVFTVASGL
jgi:hypothetical protein